VRRVSENRTDFLLQAHGGAMRARPLGMLRNFWENEDLSIR
jgi:hypothetical protein